MDAAEVIVDVPAAPVEGIISDVDAANEIALVVEETSRNAEDATDILVVDAIVPAPTNFSVPVEIVVLPVYEFTADKVSIPVPSFVKVPVEVAIGSATVILLDPPNVKLYVPVIAFPEATSREFVPASALILVAAVNVIKPAQELVPEINLSAPPLEIPVPAKDNASVPTAAP